MHFSKLSLGSGSVDLIAIPAWMIFLKCRKALWEGKRGFDALSVVRKYTLLRAVFPLPTQSPSGTRSPAGVWERPLEEGTPMYGSVHRTKAVFGLASTVLATTVAQEVLYHRVRSFSFPGSTTVCPRCVWIALKSFQGLTRVSPKCPACWQATWSWPKVHDVTTRGWVIVLLALVRGSPKWAPRGQHREANRMHPLCMGVVGSLHDVSITPIFCYLGVVGSLHNVSIKPMFCYLGVVGSSHNVSIKPMFCYLGVAGPLHNLSITPIFCCLGVVGSSHNVWITPIFCYLGVAGPLHNLSITHSVVWVWWITTSICYPYATAFLVICLFLTVTLG